jgi:hypothetical protein
MKGERNMLECNQRLLQALREERAFFRSGGYGWPYRTEWRPTLLFRDSPTCVNFSSAGALNACEECPLFRLVPCHKRNDAIPCHHIVLDAEGNTIAGLYQKGSQRLLDERYWEWLSAVIAGLEQWLEAA